jgi:hypothetical protein
MVPPMEMVRPEGWQMTADLISVAANNAVLEEAALVADAEADRLAALASDMAAQNAMLKSQALKWRQEEYKAGARAARRVAMGIRALKISEKER